MKFKVVKEFDTKTLNESNRYRRLSRALFGDPTGKIKTFAIISVENPLGLAGATDEEALEKYRKWTVNKQAYNKLATSEFKASLIADRVKKTGDETLKYGHFNYTPLKGHYGDLENSFIIFNIPLADAKAIARDYGQESFFWGTVDKVEQGETSNSKIGYYQTYDYCKTYKLVEVSNTITDETEAEDFFSKFGRKFRLNFQEFGDDIKPVTDTKAFEESFNENRPFMSRALQRKRAYDKQ